jgi:hypothetical protein
MPEIDAIIAETISYVKGVKLIAHKCDLLSQDIFCHRSIYAYKRLQISIIKNSSFNVSLHKAYWLSQKFTFWASLYGTHFTTYSLASMRIVTLYLSSGAIP